jgi:DNA topoisomerase-1
MLKIEAAKAIMDPKEAAAHAGLTYVSDEEPGVRRTRCGKGFRYEDGDGRSLKDKDALKRIKTLAIPPAWTGVSIQCYLGCAITIWCAVSRGTRCPIAA